jgi:prophage maintenance system killer protein
VWRHRSSRTRAYTRVGAASAELFFLLNGSARVASDEAMKEVTFNLAKGEIELEALAIWFRQRLRPPL